MNLGLSCHGRELLIFGKKDKTPAICLASMGDFPLPVPKNYLDTHLEERGHPEWNKVVLCDTKLGSSLLETNRN